MSRDKYSGLTVFFLPGSKSKSVSVFDSDAIANLLHMEALVATLVKYGNAGEYIPYLAESWQQNEQKTIYKFNFVENYSDQEGTIITPEKFKRNIEFLLKKYMTHSNPPVFSGLIGWDNFKSHKTDGISGITTDSKSIQFSFKNPESGLLEFLSMPYYGFYNEKNFSEQGEWKDPNKIISSGSYYLSSIDNNCLTLKSRPQDGFPIPSFNTIKIISTPDKNMDYSEGAIGPSLIIADLKSNINIQSHNTLKSTPTILSLVEINSSSNNKYLIKYKNEIYAKILSIRNNNIITDDFSTLSTGFFNSRYSAPDFHDNKIPEKIKLKIHKLASAKSSSYIYLTEMIKEKLTSFENIETEFYEQSPYTNIMQRNKSTPNYDLRIKVVDIGYRAENWVIKMMFCSDLGVMLEDPSKEICALTHRFEKGEFLDHQVFEDEFEAIIKKNKNIIPFFKTGFKFIYSDSIDEATISQTTNVPRLDMIKLKM